MITALGIAALAAFFHRILALDVEHIERAPVRSPPPATSARAARPEGAT